MEQQHQITGSNTGNGQLEIPESLKEVIDTDVLKPITGNATQENPLVLEVSEEATVQSIKDLIKGYEVTVTVIMHVNR